jgi:hypothetical protein
LRIADCGFIDDFGDPELWIADLIVDCGLRILATEGSSAALGPPAQSIIANPIRNPAIAQSSINPHSAILNPQCKTLSLIK